MLVYSHKVLLISFSLLLPSAILAQQPEEISIAILYFENNSIVDREQLEPLSKGLADMLITEISQISAFKVVERQRLQNLMEETRLGLTGAVDENTAQELGKLIGAQTLLLGGFINMFGGKMRIDVRIVEVETGVTLRAEEETGKVDDLFKMTKKLTEKIAKFFDVKLTRDDKKRLKEFKGSDNFEATLYYSEGLDAEDVGRRHAKEGNKKDALLMFGNAIGLYQLALIKSPDFKELYDRIDSVRVLMSRI